MFFNCFVKKEECVETVRSLTRDIPQGYDKIQTIDVQVCFLTVQMLIGVITTCDSTPAPPHQHILMTHLSKYKILAKQKTQFSPGINFRVVTLLYEHIKSYMPWYIYVTMHWREMTLDCQEFGLVQV